MKRQPAPMQEPVGCRYRRGLASRSSCGSRHCQVPLQMFHAPPSCGAWATISLIPNRARCVRSGMAGLVHNTDRRAPLLFDHRPRPALRACSLAGRTVRRRPRWLHHQPRRSGPASPQTRDQHMGTGIGVEKHAEQRSPSLPMQARVSCPGHPSGLHGVLHPGGGEALA